MNDFLFLRDERIAEKSKTASFQYSAASAAIPYVATSAAVRTIQINDAFAQLKTSVIQRGAIFANNPAASKGGYMAENFIAESYNLDAVLKQIDTPPATVPAENGRASADILFGDKAASVKFYKDAESSAKAQLNPEYKDQARVIPKDQYDDAKKIIENMATRNEAKERFDAANQQRDVADRLSDRISSDSGVESTPLTKEQNLEMARAISKDEDGKIIVDEDRFDKVLDETGITKRVKDGIIRNELRGLGLATAIGIGLGFTLTFISEIAQKGIEGDVMSDIAFNSIVAGTESGLVAGTTYLAGRSATSLLVNKASIDITTQFGSMLNASAVGLLSTAIVCTYQYVKLRISGANMDESVAVVKKTALSSLSMLTVSIIAQGVWGGHAGLIVSTSIGILYFSANICQNVHAQKIELRLREYSVEEYKALIDKKSLIYIS